MNRSKQFKKGCHRHNPEWTRCRKSIFPSSSLQYMIQSFKQKSFSVSLCSFDCLNRSSARFRGDPAASISFMKGNCLIDFCLINNLKPLREIQRLHSKMVHLASPSLWAVCFKQSNSRCVNKKCPAGNSSHCHDCPCLVSLSIRQSHLPKVSHRLQRLNTLNIGSWGRQQTSPNMW